MSAPTTGPVAAVLAAVADGAGTRAEIARRCGLDRMVADAVIEHLAAAGRLTLVEPAACPTGCSGGGCSPGAGSCPAPARVGADATQAGRRRPIPLSLGRRRP